MKNTGRISDITLELYNLGAVQAEEQTAIENALKSDTELLSRYEAIKKSDLELRRLYPWNDMPLLASLKNAAVPVARTGRNATNRRRHLSIPKKSLVGMGLAAAVILGVLVSSFFYFSGRSSPNEIEIAADPEPLTEDDVPVDEMAHIVPDKTEQAAVQPESAEQRVPHNQIEIAAAEPPAAKEYDDEELTGRPRIIEPEAVSIIISGDIPAITSGAFANQRISGVTIPDSVTAIEKNAFANTPLTSVTLGADVAVDEEAIPGNFASAYNDNGKAAGTYTRADVGSDEWVRSSD